MGGKKPFEERFSNSTPLPLSTAALGEGGKPFIGIYFFARQKINALQV